MFLHLNIRVWFTRSHPSKGENRTRNRSKSCKCQVNGPYGRKILRGLSFFCSKKLAKKFSLGTVDGSGGRAKQQK